MTVSKMVPTMWNELSIARPGVEHEDAHALAGRDLDGWSLYWLATPLKTTKSGAGAAAIAFSRLAGSPCGPEVPLALDERELRVDRRQALRGSTMTMPYMPLAMWCSAGAVPQWYIQTPA